MVRPTSWAREVAPANPTLPPAQAEAALVRAFALTERLNRARLGGGTYPHQGCEEAELRDRLAALWPAEIVEQFARLTREVAKR